MKKILILLIGIGLTGLFLSQLALPSTVPSGGVSVTIRVGDSVPTIAQSLAQAKIVKSALMFRTFFRVNHPTKTIKAGTYTLSGTLTLGDVSRILISGTPKPERTLRIIEGWTLAQAVDYLEKNGIGTKAEIQSALNQDWSERFSFLTQGKTLEGYLFPDTYRVFSDASPEEVIRKMLSNFDVQFPADLRAEARAKKKSLRDIVILASILEREVRSDRDRALTADLFYRRIAKGMALEADSTVNYATGKSTPQASYADLSIDSPYNTYKHRGLPPGPISNPGLSSLIAALRPEKNDYFFFLTTLTDGRVIYSRTFAEHVRNKRTYLK